MAPRRCFWPAQKQRARWLDAGAVVSSAAAGVPPRTMGVGPVPAVRKALDRQAVRCRHRPDDLNDSLAVQSLAVMRSFDLRPEITNINGGAIALGHRWLLRRVF
jgi:acetyl-CoA acetyltransferase